MWLLILMVYTAPKDAVNWKGAWELGPAVLREERFGSEKNCLDAGYAIKSRLNQGMLAPVRYQCIPADASLPAGAPR
jgi:hypothetical protein